MGKPFAKVVVLALLVGVGILPAKAHNTVAPGDSGGTTPDSFHLNRRRADQWPCSFAGCSVLKASSIRRSRMLTVPFILTRDDRYILFAPDRNVSTAGQTAPLEFSGFEWSDLAGVPKPIPPPSSAALLGGLVGQRSSPAESRALMLLVGSLFMLLGGILRRRNPTAAHSGVKKAVPVTPLCTDSMSVFRL